jgi:hypothetical protein
MSTLVVKNHNKYFSGFVQKLEKKRKIRKGHHLRYHEKIDARLFWNVKK